MIIRMLHDKGVLLLDNTPFELHNSVHASGWVLNERGEYGENTGPGRRIGAVS